MDRVSKLDLITDSKKEFKEKFKVKEESVCVAPGRINLIGEHTDYNLGLAMPIAIDRWVCTVAYKRSDEKVNIHSSNFNKTISSSLNELYPKELWEKYIFGCIQVVKDHFDIKEGIDLLIKGNVPIGFGVSSSAALEVSVIGALLSVYNLNMDSLLILKLSNRVEHDYLGIQSGMLDQYASIFSKKNNPMIIDFSNLSHQYIEMNIKNASWILINSMVDRELASSKYNQRVSECQEGLSVINKALKKTLLINELTLKDLESIKQEGIIYRRLYHVVSENMRVLSMKEALERGDVQNAGNLLNDSHDSLSNYYDVSCNEIESIISISERQKGFYGGRIMGGGFGGCAISLVETSTKDKFTHNVSSLFFDKYKYDLKIESVDFSDGFKVT